ncbi:hypothetical protein DFH09DRAFT_1077052 [Mycena vulgaris]|nr:hypothetical protein DFH09DRAFT_1077052 [Mycena vulgaris]
MPRSSGRKFLNVLDIRLSWMPKLEPSTSFLKWHGSDYRSVTVTTTSFRLGPWSGKLRQLGFPRRIIWGQMLKLRTPVDALKQQHPGLAERLMFFSAKLEGSSIRRNPLERDDGKTQCSLQEIVQRHHEHAHKRDEVLKEIRGLEGFSRLIFRWRHNEGLLSFLNANQSRCDALSLLTDCVDGVLHVSLADFTLQHAEALRESLQLLLKDGRRSDRLFGKREGQPVPDDVFAHILSELWLRVVEPVLDALEMTTPFTNRVQRIWWCPIGPLLFLPIHAAGVYGQNEGFGLKLSNFAISPHAPSLTSLINGRQFASTSPHGLKLLAVVQSSAVGQSYILGTKKDIDHIQLHANNKIPVLRLEASLATAESVQKGMGEHSWVHFACYGVQNVADPTEVHSSLEVIP